MGVTYKSNLNQFLTKLKVDTNKAYNKMGAVGVANIKKETPVKSGDLQKANYFSIESGQLFFINPVLYAVFVEFGTYKQSANAFMRRGIVGSNNQFISIITNELRV
jgi:HK97 gp10 family phage protein